MASTLIGNKCSKCGLVSFGEGLGCGHCGSTETTSFVTNGEGKLLSWSVVRVAPGRFADKAPYAICLVQLAEGERLLGRLQSIPHEEEGIGNAVSFLRMEEGGSLLFTASGQGA